MNKLWEKIKYLPGSVRDFLVEYKWTLLRGAAYTAFVIVFYYIFLWFLFPYNELTTRLTGEIADKTINISVRKTTGAFPIGLKLEDVVAAKKDGNTETPLLEARDIELTPDIFSLLNGWLSLNVNARLYNGSVSFDVGKRKKDFRLKGVIKNIYIDKYAMIKNSYGLNMDGILNAKFDIKGSMDDITKDMGSGIINIKQVVLGPSNLLGILTLPKINFGDITMPFFVKNGSVNLQDVSQTSKDINSKLAGSILLTSSISSSILNLKLKFNPTPEIEQQIRKSIPFFNLTRDQSGYFNMSVTGNLNMPMVNQ